VPIVVGWLLATNRFPEYRKARRYAEIENSEDAAVWERGPGAALARREQETREGAQRSEVSHRLSSSEDVAKALCRHVDLKRVGLLVQPQGKVYSSLPSFLHYS
jgi:hypothetical protein